MNRLTVLRHFKSNLRVIRYSALATLPVVILAVTGCSQAGTRPSEPNATAAPAQLQTQLQTNPLAINSLHPRLGWVLRWKGQGQFQSGYDILVASSRELLAQNIGNLWNSKKVFSRKSINIHYAGSALKSGQRCFWKVRVWNQAGQPSPWSKIAGWQEGLLTAADWHGAQWIGWPTKHPAGVRHPLPAIYLRDSFNVRKPIASAKVYMCGLGISKIWINGKPASGDELSPPLSWYAKRCYYVTYNVTSLLKRGGNALGVALGNGRVYGITAWVPYTFHFSPRMILMLHIRYADGSRANIISDRHWHMTDQGPIRYNNEYNGEVYDEHKLMPGWRHFSFKTSNWKSAQIVGSPGGVLTARRQPPIRVLRVIRPTGLAKVGPDQWIFDMGQNIAGWCRIKLPAKATKGRIVIRYGESLTRGGRQTFNVTSKKPGKTKLYTANLRAAKQTDTLILAANGPRAWNPYFTTHGFRFVEVTGYPGTPTLETLQGQVVHDDLPATGGFKCSNELVNHIVQACRWSMRNNWRSIPTDCPQRNERLGWMGARAEESASEMFLFDVHRFYAKWLWDMQDAQNKDGKVFDVNPPYVPVRSGDVTWPSTFITLPGLLYQWYGDKRPIEQHYAAMSRWITYQINKVKNGITSADSYGDWCAPPKHASVHIHTRDPNRLTPKVVLATAMLYKDLRLMARYARILHKTKQRASWLAEAHTLYVGFNQHVWNAKGRYYGNGSDTACILPLAAGIVPESRRQAVIKRLLWRIHARQDNHVGCGIVGLQWMFNELSAVGQTSLAWTILKQKSYPGWGFMVTHGGTTIWELWNGNTARPFMNSQDHVMLIGDMFKWLFEKPGGIASSFKHPGFEHIIMRPTLLPGLSWVHAWHRSPYGKIVSNWRKSNNGKFFWHVQIPANSFATVEIPARSDKSVTLDGRSLDRSPYVRLIKYAKGRAIYTVESGDYRFVSRLPS